MSAGGKRFPLPLAAVRPGPAHTARQVARQTGQQTAQQDSGHAAAKPPNAAAPASGLGLDSASVRVRMVQRLQTQGIHDARVLQALAQVERHRFVDPALANQAYEDTALPIGLAQTISKPSVVARMVQLLRQAPLAQAGQGLGRVLEIGSGCGYQAAVLALLAREVYSVERLRGLHELARRNLGPLRLANVHLLLGDGMAAYAPGAPYDAIIAAAGGAQLPPTWVEQLAVGGRIVAPLEQADGSQVLVIVDKTAAGLKRQTLEAVQFVPLKSGLA